MKKIIFVLFLIFFLISGCIQENNNDNIGPLKNEQKDPLINTSNKSIIEKPVNDLEIINVTYQKEVEPGELISIKVEIKNHFDEQISGITLIAVIRNSNGTIMGSSENNLVLLPLDEIYSTIYLGALPCKDIYTIQIELDSKNIINEYDKDNNKINITIKTGGNEQCYCHTDCNDYNSKTTDICENNICKYLKALEPKGEIKVLIFEVKPFDFYDREEVECCYDTWCTSVDPLLYDPLKCNNHTIISFFNRENGTIGNPSIYNVKYWYENQAKQYGQTDFTINIERAGPFIIDRFEYGFVHDSNVVDIFKNLLLQKGYNRENYDIVHYVYFDDFGFNPNTTKQGFRSFADRYGGNTFNSVSYGTNSIKTIIHEMGHTFNGDDLYTAEGFGLCKIPEGIPEPYKEPLFPQTKACLMCGGIMTKNNSMASINYLFEEVTICNYTAKKFGWIN